MKTENQIQVASQDRDSNSEIPSPIFKELDRLDAHRNRTFWLTESMLETVRAWAREGVPSDELLDRFMMGFIGNRDRLDEELCHIAQRLRELA